MEFDIRYGNFTFKHAYSEVPDLTEPRFQEHFHTTYELLLFVRGEAEYRLRGTLYKVRPGSLLIARPGEYHNIVFRAPEPYERYVMRFGSENLHPVLIRRLEQAESVYDVAGTPIEEEIRQLDSHLERVHDEVRLSICIGALHMIIAYLISSKNLIHEADYINEEQRRVLAYIDGHLPAIHSADDIADALHMSKSALYKVFSRQFDTPLMSYVRTQKCLSARSMLENGCSAAEAAESLGFNHYSSFYRDYCQVFGEPPAGARRGAFKKEIIREEL